MTRKNFGAVFAVSLGLASLPLACGDDDAAPHRDDAGSGGSGADATGGSGGSGARGGANPTGGTSGSATGGRGGSATGGSGGKATGGSGGTATGGASIGGAGGGPGGEAGGGAPEGGVGGASDGGAGGEGGVDEARARCQRICHKAEAAMCPDMSTCVEDFCEIFLNYGDDCRPYADAALRCLDERATPDEFACWYGGPAVVTTMDVTCWPEFATAAFDHHC